MVDDLQAAPLHRYRCASCGYGATRQAEPEQCPMCHRSEWNKEGWSPFTAASGDLDPTAARLAREMNETGFYAGGAPFPEQPTA
jgi:hypothetical protein